MKALTLTQPWATLVAIGEKTIETRSWETTYRGALAIHAAKGYDKGAEQALQLKEIWQALTDARLVDVEKHRTRRAMGLQPRFGYDVTLPLGAIVAVVTLDGIWPTSYFVPGSGYPSNINSTEMRMGNFDRGRYGWKLTHVRRLPRPIPCTGRQRLWTVPGDVFAALYPVLHKVTA